MLARQYVAAIHRRLAPLARPLDAHTARHIRFWLQLTAGTVVLVGAAWLFGIVAEDVVTGDPLTLVDRILANWLPAWATPAFTRAMLLVTELAGTRVTTIVSIAMALVLVSIRRWHWLLALVLTVPGGAILNQLLKIAFRRARPTFAAPSLFLMDYGFPSGHTMMATLLYGFIALFLVMIVRRWRPRALIVAVASGLIALVGFSRMYLGAHYLSDILAAIAAGVAWLVLCLIAVSTLRHRAEG